MFKLSYIDLNVSVSVERFANFFINLTACCNFPCCINLFNIMWLSHYKNNLTQKPVQPKYRLHELSCTAKEILFKAISYRIHYLSLSPHSKI